MKNQIAKLPAFAVTLAFSLLLEASLFAASGVDDYQSYSSISYGSNGGSGLGAHTYLEGTAGGVYLETSGASIDGSKSLGIFASTGGQALSRSTTVGSFGIYTSSVRFNLSNTVAFSGLNIKSSQGSTFGSSELLSWGLTPGTGNTSIAVFGLANTTINLGSEIRGAVIDFSLAFNSLNSTFTLGAKFRASGSFTTVSGSLKDTNGGAAGTGNVTELGFGNFNTGTNQNLIVDNISIVPEPSTVGMLAVSLVGGAMLLRRRRV